MLSVPADSCDPSRSFPTTVFFFFTLRRRNRQERNTRVQKMKKEIKTAGTSNSKCSRTVFPPFWIRNTTSIALIKDNIMSKNSISQGGGSFFFFFSWCHSTISEPEMKKEPRRNPTQHKQWKSRECCILYNVIYCFRSILQHCVGV